MGHTGQTRPRWPYQPVTPEWIALVGEELERRGEQQGWLADQIGVSQGAISQLLGEYHATSRLVIPICEVLGVPLPEFKDARDAAFIEAGRRLRERDPERWLKYLDAIQRDVADIDGEDH